MVGLSIADWDYAANFGDRDRWLHAVGFNSALHMSTIFYCDTCGLEIANDAGMFLDVNPLRCLDIALNRPDDDNFAGSDVGLEPTARTNRQTMLLKFH